MEYSGFATVVFNLQLHKPTLNIDIGTRVPSFLCIALVMYHKLHSQNSHLPLLLAAELDFVGMVCSRNPSVYHSY